MSIYIALFVYYVTVLWHSIWRRESAIRTYASLYATPCKTKQATQTQCKKIVLMIFPATTAYLLGTRVHISKYYRASTSCQYLHIV